MNLNELIKLINSDDFIKFDDNVKFGNLDIVFVKNLYNKEVPYLDQEKILGAMKSVFDESKLFRYLCKKWLECMHLSAFELKTSTLATSGILP